MGFTPKMLRHRTRYNRRALHGLLAEQSAWLSVRSFFLQIPKSCGNVHICFEYGMWDCSTQRQVCAAWAPPVSGCKFVLQSFGLDFPFLHSEETLKVFPQQAPKAPMLRPQICRSHHVKNRHTTQLNHSFSTTSAACSCPRRRKQRWHLGVIETVAAARWCCLSLGPPCTCPPCSGLAAEPTCSVSCCSAWTPL